jgi:ABC-type amino acid transport substrate-binding protein
MMVRNRNPEGIKTIADLCGKAVGLQSGAVQVPIAEKASKDCVAAGRPPIDIKQLGKDSEVQMLLRNVRIAVDLLDSPVSMRWTMRAVNPASATNVCNAFSSASSRESAIQVAAAKSARSSMCSGLSEGGF